MNPGIEKLKEAVEIKADIARQEATMWTVVAEALALLGEAESEVKEPPRPVVDASRANKYLTMKEVVEYLGISRNTLYLIRKAGMLTPIKMHSRAVRYHIDEIEAYIRSRIRQ